MSPEATWSIGLDSLRGNGARKALRASCLEPLPLPSARGMGKVIRYNLQLGAAVLAKHLVT